MKGWEGLNWLTGYPWAAVPVCLAIALAARIGAGSRKRESAVRFIAFLALAWGLLLLCFELARSSLYTLHSVGFLWYFPDLLRQGSLWSRLHDLVLLLGIPLAVLLAGLGLFLAIRLFLQRDQPVDASIFNPGADPDHSSLPGNMPCSVGNRLQNGLLSRCKNGLFRILGRRSGGSGCYARAKDY